MPRRHNRKQSKPSDGQRSLYEANAIEEDPTVSRGNPFGSPRVRKKYLETGIGRPLSRSSQQSILQLIGLERAGIRGGGIVYIPGTFVASELAYGIGYARDGIKPNPEELAAALYQERSSVAAELLAREHDPIEICARGLAIQKYGERGVRIGLEVLDIEHEILAEKIRTCELLSVPHNQTPKKRPADQEVIHAVDLCVLRIHDQTEMSDLLELTSSTIVEGSTVVLNPVGSVRRPMPPN